MSENKEVLLFTEQEKGILRKLVEGGINDRITILESMSHYNNISQLLKINDATNILKFASDKDMIKMEDRIEKLEKRLGNTNPIVIAEMVSKHENDLTPYENKEKKEELEQKLDKQNEKWAFHITQLETKLDAYRTYQNNCSYTDNIKSVLLKHLQECGDPLWEKLDGEQDESIDVGEITAVYPDNPKEKDDKSDKGYKDCDLNDLEQKLEKIEIEKQLENIRSIADKRQVIYNKEYEKLEQQVESNCNQIKIFRETFSRIGTQIRDLQEVKLEKGKKLPFICPECNIILDFSTTGSTSDDPNEIYYQCSNCLRRYSKSLLESMMLPAENIEVKLINRFLKDLDYYKEHYMAIKTKWEKIRNDYE